MFYDFTYVWTIKKKKKETGQTNKDNKTETDSWMKKTNRHCQSETRHEEEERKRWDRLRGINFQQQNKWGTDVSCTVEEAQSMVMWHLSLVKDGD